MGDEAEGRLQPENPAGAANAAGARRESEERLDGGEGDEDDDQERGEERRQGGQQVGGDRLSNHRGLSRLGILEVISIYEYNIWILLNCQCMRWRDISGGWLMVYLHDLSRRALKDATDVEIGNLQRTPS